MGGGEAPWKKGAPRRFAAEGSTRREAIPPTDVDRLPPSGTLHGAPERGRGEGEAFILWKMRRRSWKVVLNSRVNSRVSDFRHHVSDFRHYVSDPKTQN